MTDLNTPPPSSVPDWAEDMAHEQLVTATAARLRAAESASTAAQHATARLASLRPNGGPA